MVNRKMIMQIIFILIAGLSTVGLSIYSVLEASNKESELRKAQSELKERQDLLIGLQEKHADELNKKTGEVIELQKQLQKKSDLQLLDLDRLKNPIPETFEISFNSSLELAVTEINQIKEIINRTTLKHDNLLPINVEPTNASFEKINSFKNVHLRLIITFINADKEMTIIFNRAPLNLFGYNSIGSINSFTLYMYLNGDQNIVRFDGLLLESEKTTTNCKSPSLLDFENSKVFITYDFSYPDFFNIGGQTTLRYISNNKYNISLNFEWFRLSRPNYSIEISDLKKIGQRKFAGTWTYVK